MSWSDGMGEQLEVIKYFEQGSSQSEESNSESDDEVDEGGDDAVTALASHDAAIAADAVNAAADAAINSTAAPGPATVAQKDLVGASPGEGTGYGMWGRAETMTVAEATEARVDAASAAATAAEELLLGKGLLADNITDSQYRTSRIVLLDRGTAIKPLGM